VVRQGKYPSDLYARDLNLGQAHRTVTLTCDTGDLDLKSSHGFPGEINGCRNGPPFLQLYFGLHDAVGQDGRDFDISAVVRWPRLRVQEYSVHHVRFVGGDHGGVADPGLEMSEAPGCRGITVEGLLDPAVGEHPERPGLPPVLGRRVSC